MFLRLLMLLTLIPLLEIYVLLRVSDEIGWQGTFALVICTGFLGATLMRRQGMAIFLEIQKSLAQGEVPSQAVSRGFFVFVGGLVLLTPGVITDVIGLSFLFPPTQALWRKSFQERWRRAVQQGQVRVYTSSAGWPPQSGQGRPFEENRSSASQDVIDVEVKHRNSEKSDPHDN